MLLTKGSDNMHCYVAEGGATLQFSVHLPLHIPMSKRGIWTVSVVPRRGAFSCARLRSDRSELCLHFALYYVCGFSQNYVSSTHQINTLSKLKPKVSSSSYRLQFELKNQEYGDIKMASLKNEFECYQIPIIKVDEAIKNNVYINLLKTISIWVSSTFILGHDFTLISQVNLSNPMVK